MDCGNQEKPPKIKLLFPLNKHYLCVRCFIYIYIYDNCTNLKQLDIFCDLQSKLELREVDEGNKANKVCS